jgi:hypothetical protein
LRNSLLLQRRDALLLCYRSARPLQLGLTVGLRKLRRLLQ